RLLRQSATLSPTVSRRERGILRKPPRSIVASVYSSSLGRDLREPGSSERRAPDQAAHTPQAEQASNLGSVCTEEWLNMRRPGIWILVARRSRDAARRERSRLYSDRVSERGGTRPSTRGCRGTPAS